MFRLYTETESFGVSLALKQTGDQPKQFDRQHILVFFHKVLYCFGLFWIVSVCFETVCFSCFEFYTKTASFNVSIDPKQAKDQPKQFDREHTLVFFRKLRVSVCFGLIRNSSFLFQLFQYRFETPKQTKNFSFWFHETNRNTTETDLVSVRTEIFFRFEDILLSISLIFLRLQALEKNVTT